ncbi:MAG: hypothetical protein ACLFV3_09880 [Phycisphaeraceae bacterium]
MYVYAGIDEAGYGPMFGPLLIGRSVFAIPKLEPGGEPPRLWQRLSKAVCRTLAKRKGRIAVNDSKKLITSAAGIRHLELGCLSFAALAGHQPERLDQWLECLGETCHCELDGLPWYAPGEGRPWEAVPLRATAGEVAVARSMLASTANRIGVEVPELAAAVVLEDRFNAMVAATRSKAAVNFTFVARHLRAIWDGYARHEPLVVVDRQSGRMRYRQVLAENFPEAHVRVLAESPECSAYRLEAAAGAMVVRFEVEAEQAHMPVALASMVAKYTRELMMARFNGYFAQLAPDLAPTAGYALDAKRFWDEIAPRLRAWGLADLPLRRMA